MSIHNAWCITMVLHKYYIYLIVVALEHFIICTCTLVISTQVKHSVDGRMDKKERYARTQFFRQR